MGCMPGVVIDSKSTTNPVPKTVASPKNGVAKRTPKDRKLTKEQSHMREMRLALNLSQAAWALELNISTATVAAYEYGRTQSVSKKAYQAAIDCFARSGHILKTREQFDKMTMAEIVADWAARLKVDPDDMRTMADLMDKEVSTILRWRNNSQRPDIMALKDYDDKVSRLAIKIAKVTAKRLKDAEDSAKEDSVVQAVMIKKRRGSLQPA